MHSPSPRLVRALPLALLLALLAACAARAPAPVVDRGPRAAPPAVAVPPGARPETYVVQRGDTLFSIARSQGVEYRELVQLNALADPAKLEVGQVLRLRPPQPAPAAGAPPTDAGVQVRPIVGGGTIETRPLDPTKPGVAVPAPSAGPRVAVVKTEPRAQKLPYTEEALAALQRSDELLTPAVGTSKAEPAGAVRPEQKKPDAAKPEAIAKAEPSAATKPDAATPAKPDANDPDRVDWAWPSSGRVLSGFTEASKGIDFAGRIGDPVLASAAGKVVYSGAGLRGYGNLIIISHKNNYLSAYAHNSKILVKEGQQVAKGQKIAEVGSSDADQPKLHFEIRREGKPLDPSRYLPER